MLGTMKLTNPEVRIENCNICNSSCTICPHSKMTRPKATMSFEHFQNLVDQAKNLGAKTISIAGFGEPLLDNNIPKKLMYCSDLGMDTFTTTNASLLTPQIAEALLKAKLSHIRFSCHGIWGTQYEKVHKGLKFAETLKNIFYFIDLNEKFYKHSCKVSMSVIPMADERIEVIRQFWESYVDWLEIWQPHNFTNGKSFRLIKTQRKSCGRPFFGPVQINADGKMMVCCFDFDAQLTVGDTYRNTIEEILKGKEYEVIRKRHKTGDLKDLICDTCDQRNEGDKPLLYSSRDSEININCTSSTKYKLTGGKEDDGLNIN